jgi:hypothetical protein
MPQLSASQEAVLPHRRQYCPVMSQSCHTGGSTIHAVLAVLAGPNHASLEAAATIMPPIMSPSEPVYPNLATQEAVLHNHVPILPHRKQYYSIMSQSCHTGDSTAQSCPNLATQEAVPHAPQRRQYWQDPIMPRWRHCHNHASNHVSILLP